MKKIELPGQLWYNGGKTFTEGVESMGFMEAYKRLDRLCADIMKNGRGISAYIEEMSRIPGAVWRVPGWENDLKKLKNYRWIRNQIAHETDCDERNMCSDEDELWLEDFHRRIMEGTDPLTQYRHATQLTPKPAPAPAVPVSYGKRKEKHESKTGSRVMVIPKLILALLVVIILWLVVLLFRSL
ncbi:MAG: hypothetical protein E7436_02315 [Ruminococcaceae bacterium]|nr:hypothetical protein [Oscillospiraceae bacterium]